MMYGALFDLSGILLKPDYSSGEQKLLSRCVSYSQVTNAGFGLMF